MFKFILAGLLVGFMAACTSVLPTAPTATIPTAPTEVAQVQEVCNNLAANEAAIESWASLANTYGSLFGQDFAGKIEKLKAENEQYQKFLATRSVLCVSEEV